MQAGADGVGIVALVGEKMGEPLLGQGDYLFECRAVRRFAGREMAASPGVRCKTSGMPGASLRQ
jgi:hypothetical protein